MNEIVVTALVRHVLTAVSGALVVRYGIDGNALELIAGGVAGAAGIAWSLWDKRRKRERQG
jgi:hypothetical protein